MSGDLLANRLRIPGNLPELVSAADRSTAPDRFTAEQLHAIERRDGELLLDAGAGSGKTSVLVERFVRAVLEDHVEVGAILAITFTDKAAAELRERIRLRLRELGASEPARATEGAFISTIHGFCVRVLRAHAIAAGLDPRFVVLDEVESARLADQAFEAALAQVGDAELIAAYGVGPLRGAVLRTYAELRSRGEREPRLPSLGAGAIDLASARVALQLAADQAARELGGVAARSAKIREALARLERVASVTAVGDPWPGDLDALRLPGGNGAALSTPACVAYEEALASFRGACARCRAERVHAQLDRLLRTYGTRYAERKAAASGVDFEDLELLARDLLRREGELRDRYRDRFAQVMVDELQDTNGVQLELIDSIANDNLFVVGDAQQSIYGFRHADARLFERLGERLGAAGRRASLRTNFRSRPAILDVVNRAFEPQLGDSFRPLEAGRDAAGTSEPHVELLIVDKGEEWASSDWVGSPWRAAEARALAGRIAELLGAGATPQEVVVLTRATTDLRAYERALEERGIPTYLIGGRGYWSHPQVMDLLAYLRGLANPRDEEAFYHLLASPLVGVSLDALVLLAATAREQRRDVWWAVREASGSGELAADDRERLEEFGGWFAVERRAAARLGVEQLIERALERTGYDLQMLRMPGGERRLANMRKLMRLGREFEQRSGPDLRGFLELAAGRSATWAADAHESEAPVEGEALDAVRLMTIHRAKGLEFEIVAVADLGREPWRRAELLRIGRDGRVGLRLGRPGTGRPVPALDYIALGKERQLADAAEERRIFYVAMTRARERLILSGAAKLGDDGELIQSPSGVPGAPICWIAPAITAAGVEPSIVRADEVAAACVAPVSAEQPPAPGERWAEPGPPAALAPPAPALSYSALTAYRRCGYRFYLERVLGLPPVSRAPGGTWSPATPAAPEAPPAPAAVPEAPYGITAAERGLLVHSLLERLDFRRPVRPDAAAVLAAAGQLGISLPPARVSRLSTEIADLVEAFARSRLTGRLAAAGDVRREERFAFLLESGALITGVLDVVAREPGGRLLIVDYKSDRLAGADPEQVVARDYATQRLTYAVAALREGAASVEVAHVFLERPDDPVAETFGPADRSSLERELGELAVGVIRQEFAVSEAPRRDLCSGCPGEGGLCSWPLQMTRREATDRLF